MAQTAPQPEKAAAKVIPIQESSLYESHKKIYARSVTGVFANSVSYTHLDVYKRQMQGLMWRATNPDGTLTYAFVESVKSTYPFWTIRFLGGLMFLVGMLLMAWNVWKTVAGQKPYDAPVLAPAGSHA